VPSKKAKGLSKQAVGTAAELYVASRLVEFGLDVYAPLVDDRGVDLLIRRVDGTTDEIQVKAVTSGRWFQVTRADLPTSAANARHWILGVESDRTTWVFPARVFFDAKIASLSRSSSGRRVFDLNLDVTRRGNDQVNAKLLRKHRNAWHLLEWPVPPDAR